MSFIKRADGITVYGGSHATVRPSLADIKHGGGSADMPETAQDKMWLKQVIAAMMPFGDAACYDTYLDEESEIISRLWGVYDEACPTLHKDFNDEYFSPSDH